MAIPININDLIDCRVVESNRVEFKSDWNPTPIIHSICAFANDINNIGGGYIVVGVEEKDGAPVLPVKGIEQERVDGILKELVGLCHMIEPLYYPVAEPVLFEGKYIIVIWVSGGHGRPYKAAKDVHSDKSTKLYYIRKFSSTIIASPEEEKELFYISTDIPFDDRPNLAAEVSDLDIGLMRAHLKEIGSSLYEHSITMDALEIAKDMQLVAGPPEALRPLNVGLLMFSERPEKYFRYARIEVVDIPDPTGTNNKVSIEINGEVKGAVVGQINGGTVTGINKGNIFAPTYSSSSDGNTNSLKEEINQAQKIISKLNDISTYQKECITDLLKETNQLLDKACNLKDSEEHEEKVDKEIENNKKSFSHTIKMMGEGGVKIISALSGLANLLKFFGYSPV